MGGLSEPGLGLCEDGVSLLKDAVNLYIHWAWSISLRRSLPVIVKSIIGAYSLQGSLARCVPMAS